MAAAAVIVAAGLGGTVVQRGGADSLTGSSPEAGSAGDAAVEDGAVQDGGEVPRLGRARLLPQVRRLVRSPGEAPATAGGRAEACGAEVGPGDRTLAVSYAGAPAVLVVRAEPAGRTVVDLVVCGRSGIARSLTLGP